MYNKPWARLGTPLHAKVIFKGYGENPLVRQPRHAAQASPRAAPEHATNLVCEVPCVVAVIRKTSLTFAYIPRQSLAR